MLLAGGGGGGGGGYGGFGTQVLLAGGGGGYGGGGGVHTLNAGGGPAFTPSGGAEQQWYTNAAHAAGDIYAAKTIAEGQFTIARADAAAAAAAHAIYATANDGNIENSVQYATQHAQSAVLRTAAHNGAAAVITGAAFRSYH